MAPAMVVEALLSASVEVLLDKIASREFLDFFRSRELDVSLPGKLKRTLRSLRAVLNDAEEKQITNPAVKDWLDDLTQAVFDADDLLEEINTEALRCKVEEAEYQGQSFGDKVWNVILEQPYEVINSKLQTLIETLDDFAKEKDDLQLKVVSSSVWHGTPTSSVVDESAIYGRDYEKKKLKEYLLSEDASGSGSKIGVIAIVGMGGIGKSTLAKILYNDNEVKEKFDPKAWACVSEDFNVARVTKTLFESVTSKAPNTDNLNTLQVELRQSLSRKKFLLVLDDIWDASYPDWANLMDIFNAGELGSKIIVTTRHESVANAMRTFPVCRLEPLGDENCWSLLAKHAFGANNCAEQSDLEGIGKEIARKCGGLPLAAVALGGLLRTKLSKDHWNKVLESNIWGLPNMKVRPALLLSYHFLPAPLKRCFAYCSIFPKNSQLKKEKVVQLWIAEGLVHVSKGDKSMEEVGDEYFDELVSRSLLRRNSVYLKFFEMHDLINDLATTVSSAYCIRYEDRRPLKNKDKIRHLSYNTTKYDYLNKFDSFKGLKGLRTFLPSPLLWRHSFLCKHYPMNKVVRGLLPELKKLRVLSLYGNITELPESIGDLIHLRHLDLFYTSIERLPPATCKLYNLRTLLLSYCWHLTGLPEEMGKWVNLRQLDISYTNLQEMPVQIARLENLRTLLLSGCGRLTELPKEMGKLVNLRHLDISDTKLQEMPVQIAKLENLQTLTGFVVSKQQNGLKVSELRKFPHLRGKLCISNLHNVIDPRDASQASLKTKEQIEDLSLQWDYVPALGSSTHDESHRLVLEDLQPSRNLKKLTISLYRGTRFPEWLGDSSFNNMVYLTIQGCHHCSSLPPVGQLHSLKELHIALMNSVKTVGSEFYGGSSPSFQPFPSLEILVFTGMMEWEEWRLMEGTATEFPRLSSLSLLRCPVLKGNLPRNLPSLTELRLDDCPKLEPLSLDEVDDGNDMRPSNLFSQLKLGLSSLITLSIWNVPSLTSFPRDGLPKTLTSLDIYDCENLEFPSHESLRSYTALESLTIENSCCSLTSFPLGSLPVLKWLHLGRCKNLKSISIWEEEDASQCLTFLQVINVQGCPILESFSLLGLPTPNYLRLFRVSNCNKLNSLPEPINTLDALQELEIHGLPNLQSFAEDGLPINLRKLEVGGLGGTSSNTAIIKWGLERLTCLSELKINGDDLVNMLMKMEVPLLPSSLVFLEISGLDGIEHLEGKWLQDLTALERLQISSCESLKSLPKEGLPSSLTVLTIESCPMLEANCQSKKGKEWPKIDRIPCIIIGEEVII